MHIIRQLMRDLNEAMEESQMSWGKHMGSSLLWEGHKIRLQEWNRIVNELEMHQVPSHVSYHYQFMMNAARRRKLAQIFSSVRLIKKLAI